MQFDRLDLNLLVALDVLLREKNVSVAAERVHLSQSAMSGALSRLREYFEDDLLVSSGRKMVLTARGQSLVEPVRNALLQIRLTITSKPVFEPAKSDRKVRLLASDFMIRIAICRALRAIAAEAPNMLFDLVALESEPWEWLERGDVDLLVNAEQYVSPHHPTTLLFKEDYVVVGWADNPHFGAQIDMETYVKLGHVTVFHGKGRHATYSEWYSRVTKVAHHVEVVAPSFSDVPYLLVGTNRIATMHRRLAEMVCKVLPLKVAPVPFKIPKINMVAQWHSVNAKDPALAWVVSHLKEACREWTDDRQRSIVTSDQRSL